MIAPWLWSRLPGPAWVKAVVLGLALAGLVVVLFEVVFPWVSTYLNLQEQTVGQ